MLGKIKCLLGFHDYSLETYAVKKEVRSLSSGKRKGKQPHRTVRINRLYCISVKCSRCGKKKEPPYGSQEGV